MHPHRDGRGDLAWPGSDDRTIRGSVLWDIFGEVHGRFVNYVRVFGDDYRLELLGRQIKAEKQWGSFLAGHGRVQDVGLKEQMGAPDYIFNLSYLPYILTGPYYRRRNGADQSSISELPGDWLRTGRVSRKLTGRASPAHPVG